MPHLAKTLIIIGLGLAALGVLLLFQDKLPFGRLPGDIHIQRPGFSFHFPLGTCLLLSVLLSLLLWFFRK